MENGGRNSKDLVMYLNSSTYRKPSLKEYSIDVFFPAIFQALFTSQPRLNFSFSLSFYL